MIMHALNEELIKGALVVEMLSVALCSRLPVLYYGVRMRSASQTVFTERFRKYTKQCHTDTVSGPAIHDS